MFEDVLMILALFLLAVGAGVMVHNLIMMWQIRRTEKKIEILKWYNDNMDFVVKKMYERGVTYRELFDMSHDDQIKLVGEIKKEARE